MDKYRAIKPPRFAIFLAGSITLLSCISFNVAAHGYVKQPESRAYACNQRNNTQCGAVQWEPQSVEGPSGFPDAGPIDGKLASAGNSAFSALDEQNPIRWAKTDINSGGNNFDWHFTANHVTRNWRYYLTNPGWNSNQALTRSSFELTPFCTIDGGMVQPPVDVSHNCYVPDNRNGYQIILAVWEVGDTSNSFYNVIDVNINGTPTTSWQDIGNINPSMDLKVGDKVMTRVFNANGEDISMQTTIEINTLEQGLSNNWPHQLASAINTQHTELKAGQLMASGDISAVYGKNDIYAKAASPITRVEIAFDLAPQSGNDIQVTSLADNYEIIDQQANVTFDIFANAKMQITASLFNHQGQAAGMTSLSLDNTCASLSIEVMNPMAGHYHLQIKAVPENGDMLQQSFDLFLKDPTPQPEVDFVFPEGITQYQENTKVLQPKNGKVYQCKPFPYSGYCRQWSSSADAFEPGVGASWTLAWIEL